MTERPNVVLFALLAAAAALAALVGLGILLLGGGGAEEVGATLVSALSACVFFLLDPEHIPFSSIVIGTLALASAAGFTRTVWAYAGERRLLGALPLAESDGALATRARAAGTRLYLFPSARPIAFCMGLIRPRIVVSSGLLVRLDEEEQEAVVWHEAVHARSREPLKCLLARVATQTFFWVPLLVGLLERYLLVKELAADRAAVAHTSRRALAGALTQVIAEPVPAGAVGFAESAAARVDRLFEPAAPLPRLVAPWRLLVSGVVATVLVLALAFPTTLGAGQSDQIWHMLTTMSLHGLPGMAAGAVMNAAALAGLALLARRVADT